MKLTFQQQTIDELHSVVLQQRNELDRLKREIKDLYDMIRKVVEQSTGDDLPFERPPHY
ncbi:MAG: SlyX family protein [Planctomycetales bacterium]|nr:SlyX family protein [Planctomycetales bacterium]